jgi:hypothetical protein
MNTAAVLIAARFAAVVLIARRDVERTTYFLRIQGEVARHGFPVAGVFDAHNPLVVPGREVTRRKLPVCRLANGAKPDYFRAGEVAEH